MTKRKTTISFIGNSIKFVKIFKSIYPGAILNFYSWRSLDNLIKQKIKKTKSDIVVICGYDYASQWYSYQKYYKYNVINPFKFSKILSKKNTEVFYMDTIDKITKKKKLKKKYTLSRYEFAKKELRKLLIKKFKSLRILTLPVLINTHNKADVHGSIFTKKIYDLLIFFKYIKTINHKNLKKLIIKKTFSIKKHEIINLNPILLNIPRSLFFDRILRFLND